MTQERRQSSLDEFGHYEYQGRKFWPWQEILKNEENRSMGTGFASVRYPITVQCDYCNARHPFDLISGSGKLICQNCGHDVNTKK